MQFPWLAGALPELGTSKMTVSQIHCSCIYYYSCYFANFVSQIEVQFLHSEWSSHLGLRAQVEFMSLKTQQHSSHSISAQFMFMSQRASFHQEIENFLGQGNSHQSQSTKILAKYMDLPVGCLYMFVTLPCCAGHTHMHGHPSCTRRSFKLSPPPPTLFIRP